MPLGLANKYADLAVRHDLQWSPLLSPSLSEGFRALPERAAFPLPSPPPYSPTALAAFSRDREPSRMYRLSIAVPVWPVCLAMKRSGTPAEAAEVAKPARSE